MWLVHVYVLSHMIKKNYLVDNHGDNNNDDVMDDCDLNDNSNDNTMG